MPLTLKHLLGKAKPRAEHYPFIFAFLTVCLLQWLSLELSMSAFTVIAQRELLRSIISYCVVLCANAILLCLLGRPFPVQLISGTCFSFIAIANHYVLNMHGSPLRLSELRSLLTAMQVIDGYQFKLPPTILVLASLYLLELLILFLCRRFFLKGLGRVSALRWGLLWIVVSIATICWSFSSSTWRPVVGWSWKYAAATYGYPACLIDDSIKFLYRYEKPEGYSDAAMTSLAARYANKADSQEDYDTPDIILILNESLYDPAIYEELNLQTDTPYLSYFYNLDHVARGYNAVPYTGTNSTEYELLTSNSKALINPSAPFNFFPLREANSVVSYLKSLGYKTWAFHNASSASYSRNIAYPDLGFDRILFYDAFSPNTSYGSRRGTDSHDYAVLIDEYERGGEQPRFLYMLTYQNHGGYEQNAEEYDTVHALDDYGEDTDDLNEFLTSISLSDSALQELLEYFSTVDRKVLVAMTGDHPPSFIFTQSGNQFGLNKDSEAYTLRNMTPYIIWSNYQDLQTDYPYITNSDLLPLMLSYAGLPLSPYYQMILNVQSCFPVHLPGSFIDRDGRHYDSVEGLPGESQLTDYLYTEYNNLQKPENRYQHLFEP